MEPDPVVQLLTQPAMELMRPLHQTSTDAYTTLYFAQSEKFADSFIRTQRKKEGSLFSKSITPTSPTDRLEINITLRPGVMGDEWVGYSVDILVPDDPSTAIDFVQKWPQAGGQENVENDEFLQVVPLIIELLATPVASGNQEPPREAPESMF